MNRCIVRWTMIPHHCVMPLLGALLLLSPLLSRAADSDVYVLDVPTYQWHAGCFGTATGTLIGFWDRNGFPDLYTGPTGGGVAPANSDGSNIGIRSLWASDSGFDGRPANKPGHIDDYWMGYENTGTDPFVTAGREEHEPDCVGDFIGLNQKKWTMMNGECDGNIDGYSFNYWDNTGNKRINYTPTAATGEPVKDIQSGLRAYAQHCGYDAEVITQLAEPSINPNTPPGRGFTWEDLKREIDSGYPMLVFLQNPHTASRSIGGMPRANPEIHGMTIFGYQEIAGIKIVRVQTSWNYPDTKNWTSSPWLTTLSIRGVIAFHPKPRIDRITRGPTKISISWTGPSARVHNAMTGTSADAHWYVVERSETLDPPDFQPVAPATTQQSIALLDSVSASGFYRVRLTNAP